MIYNIRKKILAISRTLVTATGLEPRTKWLSVRLRTKWFWVRVQLQSLVCRVRSYRTFTKLESAIESAIKTNTE